MGKSSEEWAFDRSEAMRLIADLVTCCLVWCAYFCETPLALKRTLKYRKVPTTTFCEKKKNSDGNFFMYSKMQFTVILRIFIVTMKYVPTVVLLKNEVPMSIF